MNRTRYERELEAIVVGVGSDLRLDSVRDAIWERVLGNAPSERRSCDYCHREYFPHRLDQRFCPGGKCSNAYYQQRHRDRYES